MREIKFRAWDKEMEEMLNDVSILNDTWDMLNEFFKHSTEVVWMQFTGLHDKNGKEIYEGDVIKGKYWLNGKSYRFIGEIVYGGHKFIAKGVKQYKGMSSEFNPTFEVIGNIYENPELLKEEVK